MDHDTIRASVLEAVEISLSAQIKAIRSLRSGKLGKRRSSGRTTSDMGMSHIDMTYDILVEATGPLHVNDIISRIASRFNTRVDRESLVSALSKRVARKDRFKRTDKNTFALLHTAESHSRQDHE